MTTRMPPKTNRRAQKVNFHQLATVNYKPVDRLAYKVGGHSSATISQPKDSGPMLTKCPSCHRNFTDDQYALHRQGGCRTVFRRATNKFKKFKKTKKTVPCPHCGKPI